MPALAPIIWDQKAPECSPRLFQFCGSHDIQKRAAGRLRPGPPALPPLGILYLSCLYLLFCILLVYIFWKIVKYFWYIFGRHLVNVRVLPQLSRIRRRQNAALGCFNFVVRTSSNEWRPEGGHRPENILASDASQIHENLWKSIQTHAIL